MTCARETEGCEMEEGKIGWNRDIRVFNDVCEERVVGESERGLVCLVSLDRNR